jgi:hypothetical protein
MAVRKRAIYCTPTIGGVAVGDWLSVRLSFQLEQGVARASIVAPTQHGDYDDAVTVAMGSDPGTAAGGTSPPIRFSGIRRDVVPGMVPRTVVHECLGTLGPAAEFANGTDPGHVGGLRVYPDLLPGAAGPHNTATAAQIVGAVLTAAGVPYSSGDIGSSGRYYGQPFDIFLWSAGTKTILHGESQLFLPTEAGETALDYIHRYDQIDAFATPNPSITGPPWAGPTSGGFYRTFESLAGRVYRVLIGGRPNAAYASTLNPVTGTTDARTASETQLGVTTTSGTWPAAPFQTTVRESGEEILVTAVGTPWTIVRAQNGTAAAPISSGWHVDLSVDHIFTEGDNILSADFRRAYPQADYVLIKGGGKIPSIISLLGGSGGDDNLGPWWWREASSNPLMGSRVIYDKNSPSSEMIQWDTYARALTASLVGMDCQTVARARMLEVNRIIVTGTLVSPEDWLIGPGQTVLVQGSWSETGLQVGLYSHIQFPIGTSGPGQPDRLLTGEPLWVQGVDYECSHGQGGAPVMRTTVTLLGGGLPDPGNIAPPPIQ